MNLFDQIHITETNGNIAYVKIGDGPKPMVILPGIALRSTLASADIIAERFTMFSDYTIYLVDDRMAVQEGYTLENRAGDVAALMKTLGIRDACIFGASMGGMVAQYLAIEHPDLVKKAVMAATSPKIEGDVSALITQWIRMANQEELPLLIKKMNRDIYSEKTMQVYGEVLDHIVGGVSDEELDKFRILAEAVQKHDTLDRLGKIQCEVLIVGSLGDHVLGSEASLLLKKEIKNSTLIMYEDTYGHAVFDEAADFKEHMLAFFEGRLDQ